ncbi:MAG: hypothetical protein OXO50_02425 [Caldilineaceae bacterium]|nr:hypothetical protein [Caldilineaceae bacterium]
MRGLFLADAVFEVPTMRVLLERLGTPVFVSADRSGSPTCPLRVESTFKGFALSSCRDRGGVWLTTGSAPMSVKLSSR